LGTELHTFSVGFEHGAFDESAHALAVSEHCGTKHHIRRIGADDARAAVDKILLHMGEPYAFPSAVASFAMYELAAEHVSAVITGDGSDEVFCGYNRYKKFSRLTTGDIADRYESVLLDGVSTSAKHRLYSKDFRTQVPGFPKNYLRERFDSTLATSADVERVMQVDATFWLSDAQLLATLKRCC
jgi:asparagine synthase (glutamine-hydrolysing)